MNYRSVTDLNDLIVQWMSTLPRDIDVIVGVPRSGLMVGNLLALHLNLPLTDVDGLIEGKTFGGGERLQNRRGLRSLKESCHVLVVDDSIWTGGQLGGVRRRIEEAGLTHRISYAVAYAKPGAEHLIDFVGETVPLPRCFEWNVMHQRQLLSMSCVDIDGVLCHDPPDEDNDDADRYRQFLIEAPPLYLPTETVGWLVTCRLEKYRPETEEWLARHGVKYEELRMMPYRTQAERQAADAYSSYKAAIYRQTGARLFIESSVRQATEIAVLSERPVFCIETREMFGDEASRSPSAVRRLRGKFNTARVRSERQIRRLVRSALSTFRSDMHPSTE